MSAADVFHDTNVILYLLSSDDAKADRAEQVLSGGGRVSVQALNEFAAVASRKLALTWGEIREILGHIRDVCSVEPVTIETHERGLAVASRYRLHVFDAMIVASALLSGCTILYSEDLQHGQVFDGTLTVHNPFSG
jgi:predicted nucleic acid-binding protein